MSKKLIRLSFLLFAVLIGRTIADAQRFAANLSGLQQVPANDSGAGGWCSFRLNASETQLSYDCIAYGLTGFVTSVRLHGGAGIGETAPALYSLTNAGIPGTFVIGSVGFSPQRTADLRANRFYVTYNTMGYPDGEIRGQVHLANGTYNDFDGDGRSDVTVYRNSNNTFYALTSLNRNLLSQQIGQPGDSVSLTLDFDRDGRSDFSTARYNSAILWRILRSANNFLEETQWGSSSLGDFFAAADYDGSGSADIAVFRGGIWYITDGAGNYRYENFGQAGDVPAPNDFDRDGKADLAVARSENGRRVWHVQRSSDGAYYSVQWGLSSDAFFTGRVDFDGDSAADLLVIRNENGARVFYILRSSDGQLQIIRWGLSSDLPKLGDYDGDGKTDAAVTRNVNGAKVFYILQSSNGEARYETFGLPSDF